jgi:alpha-glucoside transport system substrate-binding protein
VRRLTVLGAVLALAAGLVTGCSAGETELTVLGPWTGNEEQAFRAMFADFASTHHITVNYTGTPAVNQVLQADVQKGQPPDVAVVSSPGDLARYAGSGDLRTISGDVDLTDAEYSQQWRTLLKLGTPDLYAVPVKADLKSIVWYDPKVTPGPAPATWTELLADTAASTAGPRTWCLGMEAYSTSGWPGTDWVEDILLHQSGPAVYQQWASGNLAWTSSPVLDAWTTWGQLLNAQLPPANPQSASAMRSAALLTYFADANKEMFADPPGCRLEHQGSFTTGTYPASAKRGVDYDFFPFPSFGPQIPRAYEVSVNLAGRFTDNSLARAFMAYLADGRAQAVWPSRPGGTAYSVNREVLAAGVYQDPVSHRIGDILAQADHLCLDASDVMPAEMSDAFSRAVLEYLGDPGRLDDILKGLDSVRSGLSSQGRLSITCG